MSAGLVWVQQTGLDGLRTWHLERAPGQTRCARSTGPMKALPGAVWGQVLNPCPACQKEEDAADPAAPTGAEADTADATDATDRPDVVDIEMELGKPAGRD
jgi:hypothetical protein